jgi:hypothetical protein
MALGAPRVAQTPIPSTFPYASVPVLPARRIGLTIHWSKDQILAGPTKKVMATVVRRSWQCWHDRLWRREANG